MYKPDDFHIDALGIEWLSQITLGNMCVLMSIV